MDTAIMVGRESPSNYFPCPTIMMVQNPSNDTVRTERGQKSLSRLRYSAETDGRRLSKWTMKIQRCFH